MENEMMKKEIMEAMNAGERALVSLRAAQQGMSSARSWGMWDMLGGSFFSSLMKHSRVDDSLKYIEQAKDNLRIFEKELMDVNISRNLHMEMGGFLKCADIWMDNFFVDYMMQSKINEASRQVEQTIEQVENLLGQLKAMYGF